MDAENAQEVNKAILRAKGIIVIIGSSNSLLSQRFRAYLRYSKRWRLCRSGSSQFPGTWKNARGCPRESNSGSYERSDSVGKSIVWG